MDGEKIMMVSDKMSKSYDFYINFKVDGMSEEEAEQNLIKFLRMAKLDFGLTYEISGYEFVEFLIDEGSDV